jgi:hypothetical protein
MTLHNGKPVAGIPFRVTNDIAEDLVLFDQLPAWMRARLREFPLNLSSYSALLVCRAHPRAVAERMLQHMETEIIAAHWREMEGVRNER